MKKVTFRQPGYFLPVMIFAALVLTYFTAQKAFVDCEWFGICTRIDGENISRVSAALPHRKCVVTKCETEARSCEDKCGNNAKCRADCEANLKACTENCPEFHSDSKFQDIRRQIAEKETEFENKTKPVSVQKDAIANTQTRIDEQTAVIADPQTDAANANAANANLQTLANIQNLQKEKLTTLENDSNSAKGSLITVRKQVSERYSQRMFYTLLAGASVLLSIAAFLFSLLLISRSLNAAGISSKAWIGLTALVSTVTTIALFWAGEQMNAIVGPMFNQTIFASGDLVLDAVHFINCVGFFATIWLASAANALFYSAYSLADAEIPDPVPNYQAIVARFGDYVTWLLYISALMLCVSMVRIKVIASWHLTLVSTDATDPFYKLLSDFFSTSIGVQAAFYSIMLLAIYLPVKYAVDNLKEKKGGLTVEDVNAAVAAAQPNPLQRIGIPLTGDMLVKLFAVLGPLFTGPVIDLVKSLLGATG